MPLISNVKLELLRSGPAHNQLLSPLTPYIALCGADGPVTLNLPFEHRQLLNRLARLRYDIKGTPVAAEQRESEVRDIGETLGRVLGNVPTLISELAQAGGGGRLIHLRLSVSALELGMVPFEFAIGADGFPASGSPLFIQSQVPITLTREVRRGQKLDLNWNRAPKILFAFACPEGLPAVPAAEHLRALRQAIDPWVKWRGNETEQQRLAEVKKLLTVLPDASLKAISAACDLQEYTHVHILAHGAQYEQAGNKHYGVALCNEDGECGMDIIDGERLAIALTANDASGCIRHRPTLVSLATCDSGATENVIAPGGSIAQGLNAGGIPWVIASQFPLWMRASTLAVEELYHGLLQGDDPRWVLFNLRQKLYAHSKGTHDWASIVAYSALPENFDQQISDFRDAQRRGKLEVMFDIADNVAVSICKGEEKPPLPEKYPTLSDLYAAIRAEHDFWLEESSTAPADKQAAIYALYGAAEKRIAELSTDTEAHHAQIRSRNYYRQALKLEPSNHWVITQWLFMCAVLGDERGEEHRNLWVTAREIANIYQNANIEKAAAGALATLAELELLRCLYKPVDKPDTATQETPAKPGDYPDVVALCQRLIHRLGAEAFMVKATQRQFQRYTKSGMPKEWQDIAKAALKVFDEALGNNKA